MTARPRCVAPDNTLVEAAGLMRELDVGALPICDNERLAGMVTDRDIVLRGTADGKDPNEATVRDVMSTGIVFVLADQDVEEAARIMEEKQIRRLPVLSREKRLVGIVSLGDVATSSSPAFSGTALRDVSQSNHPNARQRRLAAESEPGRMASFEKRRPRTAKKRLTTSRLGSMQSVRGQESATGTRRQRKQPRSSTKKTSGRTGRTRRRARSRAKTSA